LCEQHKDFTQLLHNDNVRADLLSRCAGAFVDRALIMLTDLTTRSVV
jgi:hypothetical protein